MRLAAATAAGWQAIGIDSKAGLGVVVDSRLKGRPYVIAKIDDEAVLSVTYDAEFGHATDVTLDLEPAARGGEWTLEVLAFEPA